MRAMYYINLETWFWYHDLPILMMDRRPYSGWRLLPIVSKCDNWIVADPNSHNCTLANHLSSPKWYRRRQSEEKKKYMEWRERSVHSRQFVCSYRSLGKPEWKIVLTLMSAGYIMTLLSRAIISTLCGFNGFAVFQQAIAFVATCEKNITPVRLSNACIADWPRSLRWPKNWKMKNIIVRVLILRVHGVCDDAIFFLYNLITTTLWNFVRDGKLSLGSLPWNRFRDVNVSTMSHFVELSSIRRTQTHWPSRGNRLDDSHQYSGCPASPRKYHRSIGIVCPPH